jgi:hypothetical protein
MLLFIDSHRKLRGNWAEMQEAAVEKADISTPFVM